MANLVTYHNPLAPLSTSTKEIQAKTSKELIANLSYDCMAYELVISRNNEIMYTDFEIVEDDFIAIILMPRGGGGGGGKNIIRTVAMIAVAVAAAYVTGGTGLAFMNGVFGTSFAAGSFGAAMFGLGVGIAGSMLVNAILPPVLPELGTLGSTYDSLSASPTYSWQVAGNVTEQGIALPKIYGRHKITPPLISKYVETIDDKQYLHLLYALNDGQISSVENIKINDNAISNYSGVAYDIRYGTNTQGLISDFDDTRYSKAVNIKLTDTNWHTIDGISDTCQRVKVGLYMPNGLFYANDEGKTVAYGVDVEVQIAPIGGGWTTLFAGRISSGSEGGTTTLYRKEYVAVYDNSGDTIGWIWQDVPYTVTTPAEVVETKAIRKVYDSGYLSPSKYQARVRFSSIPSSSSRYSSDTYFEFIEETVTDDFTYPNTALLSVRALATDQLNGGLPTVSCIVTSSHGANPLASTVAKQMLLDSGVDSNRIDNIAWTAWDNYCSSKNLIANIVCDSTMTLKKWLDTVSILGRASVVQFGSQFSPIIDKAEIIPTQCFTFGMGNILSESYKETYLPINDRANILEVTYYDSDNEYDRTVFELANVNYDSVADINKQSINLIGCTNRTQALKHARYMLNCNRYLTITAEWDADIDSLVCKYGDIVKVSHDLPQYGYSGRLVDCSTTTITLDRLVLIESGKTYAIQIRDNNTNYTYEYQVTGTIGETNTLTFKTPITTPFNLYDNYAFGEVGKVSKLFRIVRISTKDDLLRTISAIEYVPEVYSDSTSNIIPPEISALRLRNLKVTEYFTYDDITVLSHLSITWQGESLYYDVYLDDVFMYRSYETRATLQNIIAPATHTVTIKDSFGDSISSTIDTLGRFAPPEPPTNFRATQNGNIVRFTWTKSIAKDVVKYEIRSGITWETGFKIGVVGNVDTFEWFPDMNNNYRFWIKAIDYSDVYSLTAPDVLLNVIQIDEHLNVILTYDGLDTVTPPCGTTTGLIFVSGIGYIPISSATYDDIPLITYDDIPTLTYGDYASFEGCVLDTTKNGLTKIRMLSNYTATNTNITYDTYPTRTYNDYPFDTYDAISSITFMPLYYKYSVDNVTYSDWILYTGIVDETFRYIQFKYELTGDINADISISDFKALLDVPDITYDILSKAIVSSETIYFSDYSLTFYEAPRVIVTSKTLALGVVTSITTDSFVLSAYDVSGSLTSGTFDIEIKGY